MHFKMNMTGQRMLKGALISAISFMSISAFALTPGSGTWVKESTLFGLQDAQVYVPKNTSPATLGGKRALMVTLHGCGMTAAGNVINKKFNWESTAEQYGMVVVAPTVPAGTTATRAIAGCWDWTGANHSRTTRDEALILKLVDAIKARSNLDIDPRQIYITGFSSGAGLTTNLACLAPDYFSGFGAFEGPELTSTSTTPGSKARFAPGDIANWCKQYAGVNLDSLTNRQIASFVHGTSDTSVDISHSNTMVEAFKRIYDANISGGTFSEVKSTGETWRDADGNTRISYIKATGLTHKWSAGAGGSGGGIYVDYTHVNYPAYVTKFFFENNMAFIGHDPKPVVQSCSASVPSPTATSVTICGAATDNGFINAYKVVLVGPTSIADNNAGSSASFCKNYAGLASGVYKVQITAIDNLSQASMPCAQSFEIGSAPPLPPGDITVGSITSTSLTLTWTNVPGVTSYIITRNGAGGTVVTSVPASSGTTTSLTVTGLAEGSPYSFTIQSVKGDFTSEATPPVVATTSAANACVEYYSSTYTHVQKGRAHNVWGFAYANGSNQLLGLSNLFYYIRLAHITPGTFVIGKCPP